MESNSLLIMWIIIWCIVGFLIAKIFMIKGQVKDRQLSIKWSKAVILGHTKEQMAPLFPNFPYHTKDMVFVGKWFDYLVLDGLAQGNLRQIVFLEIKSGGSMLNRNEKQIQNIINIWNIKYEIIRL